MAFPTESVSDNLLPLDWRSVLQCAANEQELVAATRDYLACWGPEEIARLPIECRPGRLRDAEDMSQWAFELRSHQLAGRGRPEDDALLLKMALFANEAVERLAKLKAAARSAEEDPA
jgi:hypothetical protein